MSWRAADQQLLAETQYESGPSACLIRGLWPFFTIGQIAVHLFWLDRRGNMLFSVCPNSNNFHAAVATARNSFSVVVIIESIYNCMAQGERVSARAKPIS